ncbi:MAG: hypothetical protein F4Z59_05100 [Gemmatimonadales bacterium]|nr:hypothetical protein [Gemmatimonadales bacterium]
MSESDKKAPFSKVYAVPIDQVAADQINQLMPAVCKWRAEDGGPPPHPGEIVCLAIAYLHEQVFTQAAEIVEKEQGRAAQWHFLKDRALFP